MGSSKWLLPAASLALLAGGIGLAWHAATVGRGGSSAGEKAGEAAATHGSAASEAPARIGDCAGREEAGGSSLVNGRCDSSECLVRQSSGEVYGVASIEGYFARTTREHSGRKKDCDSFVMTGGSEALRDYFAGMVDRGNTVNSKDAEGRPVINLDLSKLDGPDKGRLQGSGSGKSAKMLVLVPIQAGSGAPECFSFVDILRVEQ